SGNNTLTNINFPDLGVPSGIHDFGRFGSSTNVLDCKALCDAMQERCTLFALSDAQQICWLKSSQTIPYPGQVVDGSLSNHVKLTQIPVTGGVTSAWCLSRQGTITSRTSKLGISLRKLVPSLKTHSCHVTPIFFERKIQHCRNSLNQRTFRFRMYSFIASSGPPAPHQLSPRTS
ncbi:hypothetical protein M427DRAFT_493332, partial [Gonapodya prolifera JEL478]